MTRLVIDNSGRSATGMHVHMPDEKKHLAALAQHKTLTQSRYYRVHDKLIKNDRGRRAVSKLVALKSSNIHQPEDDLNPAKVAQHLWKREEIEQLRELFKEDKIRSNQIKSWFLVRGENL